MHCWWECRLVKQLWKTVWNFRRKLKMELPFDPEILLLVLYSKDLETPIQKNICTPMFIAAQFTIAKCWKQPKCPSAKWVDQKTMVHLHNRILHSRKKGAPILYNSVDRTGEHFAKWNKPDGERQISYDLTYKRNLMNKQTNEQNRTWGMETQNRLTTTRGEGRRV